MKVQNFELERAQSKHSLTPNFNIKIEKQHTSQMGCSVLFSYAAKKLLQQRNYPFPLEWIELIFIAFLH